MPRSSSTTLTASSSSATAAMSPDAITPPAPNRPPVIVTTTNDLTPRIQVSNTKAPRKPQCRAFIPKNKNLKANTETLLQAMQGAPHFTRYKEARKEYEDRQQKAVFESGSSNFDQDLLMKDIIAREDEFIAKDRERLVSEANLAVEINTFQAAGIDIRDQATEEHTHAARRGRTMSEGP
ncbi:hypothetical protein BG015_010508 [Linnemannia schmuckeri]|uniref:Uncharacterized protein n=1 Tax=Linnemannia schmuckeri TaxID=64567 RepID=A0A9P5V8U3_9FUNG|nr:hypothetical protein BG015_010508 [Linnemannia schmuckeri]